MLRMIESGGVLPLMRFGASPVLSAGVDEQVAVTLGLVAGGPTVDVAPIATAGDHVNVDDSRGESALPSAFPVWSGRTAGQQDNKIYEVAHNRITLPHVKQRVLI